MPASSPSQASLANSHGRPPSTASISSPTLDNVSISQHLDQIHDNASKSEGLTTFREFAPPPPGGASAEGNGLASDLVNGGLSGLYSRMRGVVDGVRGNPEARSKETSTVQSTEQTVSSTASSTNASTSSSRYLTDPTTPATSFQPSSGPSRAQSQKQNFTGISVDVVPGVVPSARFPRGQLSASGVGPAIAPVHAVAHKDSDRISLASHQTGGSKDDDKLSQVFSAPDEDARLGGYTGKSRQDVSSNGQREVTSSLKDKYNIDSDRKRPSIGHQPHASLDGSANNRRDAPSGMDGSLSLENRVQSDPSLVATPAMENPRSRMITRISESHLPNYRPSRSPSTNTSQSSLLSPLEDPTQKQYFPDMAALRQPAKEQASVDTVLRQLKSGLMSKEYWMKDENCRECFLCGDTFSTWRRRHHCRTCGQIFDAKCTTLVPGERFGHSGSMRVCKPCLNIIVAYDSESDMSDDSILPVTIFQQGKAPVPTTPKLGTDKDGNVKDDRLFAAPMLTIPLARRGGDAANRRSAVLEIGADMIQNSPHRPSSSRSSKPFGPVRPVSNHRRHQSRLQLPRFFKSGDSQAPFHQTIDEGSMHQSRLPAFHNDSIIDPELAPFLSDDNSSGDEQMSILQAMSSGGVKSPEFNDPDRTLTTVLQQGKKSRSRPGGQSFGQASMNARDFEEMSVASAHTAYHPRNRKRHLSSSNAVQIKGSPKGSRASVLIKSLGNSIADTLNGGASVPQTPMIPPFRLFRQPSMRNSLNHSVELNPTSLEHVRRLFRQLLEDHQVPDVQMWETVLVPILLKCTDEVVPDIRRGDDIDIRHYVKLKKIPGGRITDTSYVSGLVFTKNLALKSMQRSIPYPNIVVVAFSLEYQRHEQHFMSLEPVISQEKQYLRNMVNRIVALRPHLLLVEKNVSGLALEYLADAGVAAAYNVKPSVIEAVARCTETDIVPSVDIIALKPPRVGKCANMDVRTFVHKDIPGGRKTCFFLSGCQKDLGCTIVLRGADVSTLRKIKRITEFMVYVVYNLKLETSLMRDEFLLIPTTLPVGNAEETKAPPQQSQTRLENDSNSIIDAKSLAESHNTDEDKADSEITNLKEEFIPDDVPLPTFYSDLLEKQHTKILSASPFVKFSVPYLLMRARELERRLSYIKRLRDEDNASSQSSEVKVSKSFRLITPEMVNEKVEGASPKVKEILNAVHEAEYDRILHIYNTQKRQWEAYLQSNAHFVDPFAHQNIVILYTLICSATSVPCSGPSLLALGFYNEHESGADFDADCTLGQYIEDLCESADTVCSSHGCDKKMTEHHRSYVHGEGRLSIVIEKMESKVGGLEDRILLWSFCKICKVETQATIMSDEAWKYSFGKYLELSFWGTKISLRADICPHNIYRDHIRYFGYKSFALRVQYDPIELLEIIVPRPRVTWKVEKDLSLKNEIFTKTEDRLNRFMTSVKARLSSINIESVSPLKLEDCKVEIQNLTKRANEEHTWLIQKLQDKYVESKYYEVIPLNRAVRALQEKVAEWDATFARFDDDFFPSENDIRRLAALQLRKLFLDREDSVSSITTSTDGSTQRDSSEKTDASTMEESTTQDTDGTGAISTSATSDQLESGLPSLQSSVAEELPDSVSHLDLASPRRSSGAESQPRGSISSESVSPTDTKHSEPRSSLEYPESPTKTRSNLPPVPSSSAIPRLTDGYRRKSNAKPAFSRTLSQPAQIKTLQSTQPADEKKTMMESYKAVEKRFADRLGFSALKHGKKQHSLIPRSIRKDSRVSALAKHFEQLSREFEKERQRERREQAAANRQSRAYPRAKSKPIVEVFQNINEAVAAKDTIDDLEVPETVPEENIAQKDANESLQDSVEGHSKEESICESTDNDDMQHHSEHESDGDGAAEDLQLPPLDGSLGQLQQEESLDLKLDLPKHEKSSVVKMLTNFWAERSASGWTSLEYPLNASDHIFVDSDVIVREDEPSSLIAFALSSEDYLTKLDSIWNVEESDSSSDEHVAPDIEAQIERSLLSPTGTHLKYQFQEGSAKMLCKIFYAEQFEALRRKCEVSDRIIESLSRCVKWDSRGGKTRALFLKTLDDRFVLKSLSPVETQAFLKFAPAYFQIMSEVLFHELPSIIAKIFGFYQIIVKNPTTGVDVKWDIVVMENLFYGRKPTKIFDLKGSMRNRKIQSTGEQNEVLLDENMVDFIYESPLFTREHSKKLIRASVWNDTLFLARQNVMDYSLMVAIDEGRKELVVGIIDVIRTFTWDKKLESWIKDRGFVGGGSKRPTVTSPKEYKTRFREAMERYILQAPNSWHQFNLRREGRSQVADGADATTSI